LRSVQLQPGKIYKREALDEHVTKRYGTVAFSSGAC
jgi:hypothetical protein